MRLFTELRRRNVLRMAALYVVAAWLVMQVAGVLIDLGALTEQVGPWILGVLFIGFPIALLASWIFEITPEGVSLEKDIPEGQSITHVTGRRMDFVIIAILSAGLIVFAYDKWWPQEAADLSIAVLAFENMSDDPGQEYFSDGISEEILNLLAQIGPLKVIARTSSFSFKDKNVDIATMAEQLNVRHILEGSVRRLGDRVRITAQLIDATDSSHLWSQTYDRDLAAADLFYVQSDIARVITRQLRMTLTGADEQRLANIPTENTDAYAAYLLGRHRLTDRQVEGLGEAAQQFALAIEFDPEFAAAWSGLADACHLYEIYSGGYIHDKCPPHPDASQEYAQTLIPLARKAVQLDEESGEAWVSLGNLLDQNLVLMGRPRHEAEADLKEVREAFERGLALNPTLSQGYLWYTLSLDRVWAYDDPPKGWFAAWKQGTWQSVLNRGLEVDPLSIPLHYLASYYPFRAPTLERAWWHARRMIEIAPDSPRGYERLGELSWNFSGRIDDAIRWESKSAEIDPLNNVYPHVIGRAYVALGDLDMALAYFERARQNTSPQARGRQAQILVDEAAAWLASDEEQSVNKARERLEQSEMYNWRRHVIEASLALASGRAAEWMANMERHEPGCLATENIEVQTDNCPFGLERVLQELGDHERARALIEKRLEKAQLWFDENPARQGEMILRTSCLAMLGREEEALDIFEELVQSGWRGNFAWNNPGLPFFLHRAAIADAIRDHPRFQAAIAVIEADMAQQLENVRAMERRGEIPTLEELRAMQE